MSCEHLWGDCGGPQYSIRPIAYMDKTDLCCKKCGHTIMVDKWDRWDTIVLSWRANGLMSPEIWEDVDDTCALKPWIEKLYY